MSSVARSWQIIEKVLWEHAHSVYRSLRKPVTENQLGRLSAALPVKLPRDVVDSMRVHDGMRNAYLGPNRLFNYQALLPVSSILADYRMMCELQAECNFGGSQVGCDPEIRNDTHWRAGWVPLLDGDGDKIVLDLDPASGGVVGQIITWSDTGSLRRRVLAPSFKDWLAQLAEIFEQRHFDFYAEGGIRLKPLPNGGLHSDDISEALRDFANFGETTSTSEES